MSIVRYNYRLRPGKQALWVLCMNWNLSRWLWNECVAKIQTTGKWMSSKDLTELRKEHSWLRAGSSTVQQQTIRNFCAKRAQGHGRRKYKSAKRTLPSLNYTRSGFKILPDGRLYLQGGIRIPVVWSRELPSPPSSVRIYQDSIGHWYASFVVEREETELPESVEGVGVDWGISDIATVVSTATGFGNDEQVEYDLSHPEFGKKGQKKLTRYQRQMARRKPLPGKKASRGYQESKLRVAKQHKKVVRQRTDVARNWVRSVARDHGLIAVEDFKPQFMFKSNLARTAADAAIGATKKELINYGTNTGRTVILVPAPYTTVTCNQCDARTKHPMPLSQRTFSCSECGYVAPRDKNSARVILVTAGRGLFDGSPLRANVDDVRRYGFSQEASIAVRVGNPWL